jgi:Protease inhibitor Inh
MMRPKPALCSCLLVLVATTLAGCSSFDRFASFDSWTGKTKPAEPGQKPAVVPAEMAGRWTLASPGRGQCAMIFGAPAQAAEGSIAPEGGCPGKFFTSRKWTYEQTGLVIRDHNGEPLAQLSMAGNNFGGQAASGEAITLAR